MVVGMCRNIKLLRESRKEMTGKIQSLLLCNMLDHLSISIKSYFRKTSDLDKERHIRICQNCTNPEVCERMLLGENIDPDSFCPNYHELKYLQPGQQDNAKSN